MMMVMCPQWNNKSKRFVAESLIGGSTQSRVWMNVTVSAAGGKCSLMPLHDRLIITSALKKYDDNNRLKLL